MCISDWSSDVCSSVLSSPRSTPPPPIARDDFARGRKPSLPRARGLPAQTCSLSCLYMLHLLRSWSLRQTRGGSVECGWSGILDGNEGGKIPECSHKLAASNNCWVFGCWGRSEEHTSELKSL